MRDGERGREREMKRKREEEDAAATVETICAGGGKMRVNELWEVCFLSLTRRGFQEERG